MQVRMKPQQPANRSATPRPLTASPVSLPQGRGEMLPAETRGGFRGALRTGGPQSARFQPCPHPRDARSGGIRARAQRGGLHSRPGHRVRPRALCARHGGGPPTHRSRTHPRRPAGRAKRAHAPAQAGGGESIHRAARRAAESSTGRTSAKRYRGFRRTGTSTRPAQCTPTTAAVMQGADGASSAAVSAG